MAHESLGWNWARRTGDGNRSLRSTSPDATSHSMTFQSEEELSSFRPLRFQLEGEERERKQKITEQKEDRGEQGRRDRGSIERIMEGKDRGTIQLD